MKLLFQNMHIYPYVSSKVATCPVLGRLGQTLIFPPFVIVFVLYFLSMVHHKVRTNWHCLVFHILKTFYTNS